MAARSYWSEEHNHRFKKALRKCRVCSPTRFEKIARYVPKPIADVKQHYEQLVQDLLEAGSSQEAYAMVQSMSMYHVERPTVWSREEHEWFLTGLRRFKKDWQKIAILLVSKTPIEVAIYAKNFFEWKNSTENEAADNHVGLGDPAKNLVRPELQPQQELIVPKLEQSSYS